MTTSGFENGEVDCSIRPAARYRSKMVSIFFARTDLMRYRLEITGGVPGGTESSKCSKEHEPKSVLDFENTSANS